MAGVFPNGAEDVILNYITNNDAPETLILELFTSNTTPGETDTLGTYTLASWTGYANISLTPASWTVATGTADYPEQTFTSTAAQGPISNYGYLMKRTTTLDLIVAERFTDGPYSIANNGDNIKVTPQLTAS